MGMVSMKTEFKKFLKNKSKQLEWRVTLWEMSPEGGWKTQPVILVEGRRPFFADHPDAYIAELERLHLDPGLQRGPFNTFIGQFKDAVEQVWKAPRKGEL